MMLLLLTEPYKKSSSDSPAAVDAEAEEVQLEIEVTWPGGVCPALPACRVPVLQQGSRRKAQLLVPTHSPPSVQASSQLLVLNQVRLVARLPKVNL